MIERQLFKPFIPPNTKVLLLGGFTAAAKNNDKSYDWYYCSKRNQFWKIISEVYNKNFKVTPNRKIFSQNSE
jgi:G:T/U-mismatch repair DNA glycosylase